MPKNVGPVERNGVYVSLPRSSRTLEQESFCGPRTSCLGFQPLFNVRHQKEHGGKSFSLERESPRTLTVFKLVINWEYIMAQLVSMCALLQRVPH